MRKGISSRYVNFQATIAQRYQEPQEIPRTLVEALFLVYRHASPCTKVLKVYLSLMMGSKVRPKMAEFFTAWCKMSASTVQWQNNHQT